MRCWQLPTPADGSDAVTPHCCWSRFQTGLRVSELTGLRCGDVHLGRGAHIRCTGKGRKARCTPLTNQTITVLRSWLAERRGQPDDPLFATSRGRPLTPDAIAWLLRKHAATASHDCPTMQATTITPHVLRHTAAMRRGLTLVLGHG